MKAHSEMQLSAVKVINSNKDDVKTSTGTLAMTVKHGEIQYNSQCQFIHPSFSVTALLHSGAWGCRRGGAWQQC